MTTVETVPTDLPDLEWLDKDADSLGRMASFLFDPKPAPLLDDELRGVADHLLPDAIADRIAFLNRSVLNAAEPEHRRHALTHFVAVGWAKV